MFFACACSHARVGTFMLTLAAGLAGSAHVLAGIDPQAAIYAAWQGDIPPIIAGFAALVAVGLYQLASGLRALSNHSEPLDGRSLLWSGAILWAVHWALHNGIYRQPEFTPATIVLLHLWLVAWGAGNLMNVVVQLRALIPTRRTPSTWRPTPSQMITLRRTAIEEAIVPADLSINPFAERHAIDLATRDRKIVYDRHGRQILPPPDPTRTAFPRSEDRV